MALFSSHAIDKRECASGCKEKWLQTNTSTFENNGRLLHYLIILVTLQLFLDIWRSVFSGNSRKTTLSLPARYTVYPKKYAHGFVVLCFVVVMQSFIMNSHEVFIHIHQGCFAGTGAIVRLPQCQWSKPGGYGKISQCITTTKHSKAKTVCIFLGIYCRVSIHIGYLAWLWSLTQVSLLLLLCYV